MKELGVMGNSQYKLCMLLDDLAMITVDTPTYGVIEASLYIPHHCLGSHTQVLEFFPHFQAGMLTRFFP